MYSNHHSVERSNMNGPRNKCIFTWFVENYSHSWHGNGEELTSPEFTADDFGNTVWTVKLYPRGCRDSGYVSIFLKRNENDNGPEDLPLRFKLSFLRSDGTDLHAMNWKYTFKRGTKDGWFRFLRRKEVFSEGNEEYLPEDTLSVRCEMWKGEGNIEKLSQMFARTRIAIERVSFLQVAENFSTIETKQKKTVHISSDSKKAFFLSSSLYFTDGSCCEEKIIMEMTPISANKVISNCRISLVNRCGEIIPCGMFDNRFDDAKKEIKKVPLLFSRRYILENKTEYLPNDKLLLLCKCIFPTAIECEIMESKLGEKCVMTENRLHENFQYSGIYNAADKLSACPNALDDLKAVYNDNFLTDVELKTKTKSFPAHKILLCARSSVFKAMLTNDMKEKNTNQIQVDDLENDTVQQLLFFLYSDSVENLHWESAIKLYYAADKYEVEKLKVICSSFLVGNLNTANASELLLLADTHNDCDLKTFVENFILKHDEEVFGSNEWGYLMETNPLLVSKTMRLKYIKKL